MIKVYRTIRNDRAAAEGSTRQKPAGTAINTVCRADGIVFNGE